MASAGGNYLLNVSPRPDGRIPEEQVARMAAIGDWLRVNGEAIYCTQAGKLQGLGEDLRATRRGADVYVFVRRWPPSDHLVIPGIRSQPTSARLLAGAQALRARLTDEGLEVSRLPLSPPDANPQTIRLCFEGEPTLDLVCAHPPAAAVVPVRSESATRLRASDAVFAGFAVKGGRLRVQEETITGWMTEDQCAIWTVRCDAPGRYGMRIQLRCATLYAGSTFAIRAGAAVLAGTVEGRDARGQERVPASAPGGAFCWQDVGEIDLPAGTTQLALAPTYMPYGYLFAEVKAIELRPAARGV